MFELQQESSRPMSDRFVGSDRVPIKQIAYTIPAHHPPPNGGCHPERLVGPQTVPLAYSERSVVEAQMHLFPI